MSIYLFTTKYQRQISVAISVLSAAAAFLFIFPNDAAAGAVINRAPTSLGLISGLVGYWIAGNQKLRVARRVFDVDPGRLALPSSGANADMLLHTPQARIHVVYNNKKNPFCKGFLL